LFNPQGPARGRQKKKKKKKRAGIDKQKASTKRSIRTIVLGKMGVVEIGSQR
jgi:hypothetical protein